MTAAGDDITRIRPEDVPEREATQILEFLNAVETPEEIAEIVEVPGERDVGIGVAQNILDRRQELGGFDNLAQVAHHCEVGEHSILVSQVGMAGSCKLGHHVILAGQVGLADHVTLGDHVIIAAKSATSQDIGSPGMYGGIPAIPALSWKKYLAILPKLPELSRKIKKLEKRLEAIENK